MDISELNDDDVISEVNSRTPVIDKSMFKARELKSAINGRTRGMFNGVEYWLGDGVDCEVLDSKVGGWRKGKFHLRVTAEFIPDEPETSDSET
jgi:hypothetical protein